jgi:hypothetical protein
MSETRIAIFSDQEQIFEGLVQDFKAQGIDVEVVRRDDPIVIGAGLMYHGSFDAVRFGFEGGKAVLLDPLVLPPMLEPTHLERLQRASRGVRHDAPVKEITQQDRDRMAAAEAKRARKAAKLRKETKA